MKHPLDYAEITETLTSTAMDGTKDERDARLQEALILSNLTIAAAIVHAAELRSKQG